VLKGKEAYVTRFQASLVDCPLEIVEQNSSSPLPVARCFWIFHCTLIQTESLPANAGPPAQGRQHDLVLESMNVPFTGTRSVDGFEEDVRRCVVGVMLGQWTPMYGSTFHQGWGKRFRR